MSEQKEQLTKKYNGFPPMLMETPLQRGIVPKTDFGRELLALRNKAIADVMKLRGAEEILSEIEESRQL
jgi:hypothetical protein